MTPRFILDENVVIFAQLECDETGSPNSTCVDLFQQIVEICHTIVVDDTLWDKYVEQLNRPANFDADRGPWLMRAFYNLFRIDGKLEGIDHNAPGFAEESSIPQGSQDDVFIVRLAVETRAILVTADRPLREDLASSGVASRYSLRVVSPQEALGLLGRA